MLLLFPVRARGASKDKNKLRIWRVFSLSDEGTRVAGTWSEIFFEEKLTLDRDVALERGNARRSSNEKRSDFSRDFVNFFRYYKLRASRIHSQGRWTESLLSHQSRKKTTQCDSRDDRSRYLASLFVARAFFRISFDSKVTIHPAH